MKLEVRPRNIFYRYFPLLAALLMLVGCQSLSEKRPVAGSNIHTLAHKETATLFPVDYRKSQHSLFLVDDNENSSSLPLLAEIMKSQGFNVVANEDEADYIMHITSFVTMPGKEEGKALPYSSEFLLSIRKELPVLKPLLVQSSDSPGEQIKSMAKLVSQSNRGILSGSDTSNIISAGTTFGGGAGGLIAGAAASVFDAAAGIVSKNSIREGLAGFNFLITKNATFMNQAFGFNVYAASTTPEMPEALLRAAVERASVEVEQNWK